jgi:predicted phage-related endonuclease
MGGNDGRIITLWRQKRGEAEPDDLSDILAVQMGSFTEPLNCAWYEKQTGNVVQGGGKIARHPTIKHMRATLDGEVFDPLSDERLGVFEAKHCGTRSADAELFARYVPQLTHNCLCAGAETAFLSIFKGNGDWVLFEYELDAAYAKRLIEAEAAFWECVRTGTPPAPLPDAPTPKPKGVKEYDMQGSNEWAAHAADYLETEIAADRHEIAKRSLKALVPDDASRCVGHGILIARDKRGALRFGKGEAQ